MTRIAWSLLFFWAKAEGRRPARFDHRCPHREADHEAGLPGGAQEAPLRHTHGWLLRMVRQPRGREQRSVIHPRRRPAVGRWPLRGGTDPLLPDGNLSTFTIITGDGIVSADIQERMPVWFHGGQIGEWLAASRDDALAMLLVTQTPASRLRRSVLLRDLRLGDPAPNSCLCNNVRFNVEGRRISARSGQHQRLRNLGEAAVIACHQERAGARQPPASSPGWR